MTTIATLFASIIALFSGLLGHPVVTTKVPQPSVATTSVLQVTSTSSSQILLPERASSTIVNSSSSKLLTYQNKKYGLEFKYPPSLTDVGMGSNEGEEVVASLGVCPTAGDMCQDAFSILVSNKESLDAWYKNITREIYGSMKPRSSFEDVMINGLPARKITNPVESVWRGGAPCYITAFYVKGKVFQVCDNLHNEATQAIINSLIVH